VTTPVDLSKPASAFMEASGLHLEEVGPSRVAGWVDLGPEHHQPMGLVHGGVYAAVIETAASAGATLAAQEDGSVAVGVNNNTHFLRSMSSGRVSLLAEPIQQGRTQQLWEVRITDGEDRLVAIGQVRLQNVQRRG
jgi:1,4-dihydroxy-2-naphthoyl-CoA hydrolase